MKQQGRRSACAGCVTRKHLKFLVKAYLLCIILSWLVWNEAKRAHKYYKTLAFNMLIVTLAFNMLREC